MTFARKPNYNITDLLAIMALLRSERGCPWDREQDHHSIRENFLEETCEVLEAIDDEDSALLLEELGDVLLQVVFHSQIEKEQGSFDFDDVADGVCKKLIIRHPHIFGETPFPKSSQGIRREGGAEDQPELPKLKKVDSAAEVLRNWDEIKAAQKQQKTVTESLKAVPKTLPALMKAAKVQKRAAKIGFDWKNIAGTLDKLDEEVIELKTAITQGDDQAVFEEFGDLLFAAVNVSRFLHVEPEQCLHAATAKFIARFALVEQMAAQRGIDMQSSSLDELDKLWEEAKRNNHT